MTKLGGGLHAVLSNCRRQAQRVPARIGLHEIDHTRFYVRHIDRATLELSHGILEMCSMARTLMSDSLYLANQLKRLHHPVMGVTHPVHDVALGWFAL